MVPALALAVKATAAATTVIATGSETVVEHPPRQHRPRPLMRALSLDPWKICRSTATPLLGPANRLGTSRVATAATATPRAVAIHPSPMATERRVALAPPSSSQTHRRLLSSPDKPLTSRRSSRRRLRMPARARSVEGTAAARRTRIRPRRKTRSQRSRGAPSRRRPRYRAEEPHSKKERSSRPTKRRSRARGNSTMFSSNLAYRKPTT